MLLSFDPSQDGLGMEIVDHIERRRCRLHTSGPVDPRPAPDDGFHFPVDRGVRITTEWLSILHTMPVYVRNSAGLMIAELSNGESRSLPHDRYSVELCAPIKLYAVVESELDVSVAPDHVTLEFDGPVEVLIGARSHHKHPAATITTTDDPGEMMDAISYFGSALKTTTCERSYPTLRGHPPTIDLGDELHVPDVLERPDTGVTLELPADHRSAFVAAPLVYYLGADAVPGDDPRVVTDTGFVHPLDDPTRGFEGEVERVLKQAFFLDCVTRTEGYYQVDLHERSEIEDTVALDFADLYDRPLAEQLEAYLDVPYTLIEPHVPEWKLTAHVQVLPHHVETLPFVVNDLAVIRSADPQVASTGTSAVALDDFARGDGFTRSVATRSTAETAVGPSLIRLDPVDSLEQTWIGEGAPLDASKAMIEAFQNRLDRTPTDGDIDITVVCNDTAMGDERDVVDEVYGSRDELPFDVTVHREVTADELHRVLERETDFLHYIGHIDERGFQCADGMFDALTLDSVGVDAFFLNACTSYEQGKHLIEAGSIAGVVTLQDIINSGAEQVGQALAQLLNRGFPLRAALTIAKTQSIMGGHYLVIGDGNLSIAQPESGTPILRSVDREKKHFNVEVKTYPTSERGMGSIFIPYIDSNQKYFLNSGSLGTFQMSRKSLIKFLKLENTPLIFNDRLTWTDQFDFSDF